MHKKRLFGLAAIAGFICLCLSSAIAAPLPARDVFKVEIQKTGPDSMAIKWSIRDGYYLYKDRIRITETQDSLVHPGTLIFPEASQKKKIQGEVYAVYQKELDLQVPLVAVDSGESLLFLHYQGCSEAGFCYPPETRTIKVAADSKTGIQSLTLEADSLQAEKAADIKPLPLKDKNIVLMLLTFFGLGLLLAFTPCILPMVPVLSGIIVGHSKTLTTAKSFFLSLSYVLSMAFTYALMGMLVASIGANLQIMMQTPWVIVVFSALFVLLSLSMFGFYDLKLPVAFQQKLGQITRSQSKGHYLSAAIMGCLSTLILSPCVTAPLIGVLSFIADTGKILTGGLALFFLGLGMGTPLLLIGLSAGKLLPKAGAWMNGVKDFFGVLLLAVAVYLMGRLLPDAITMILWAGLLVTSGIFTGALLPSRTKSEKFRQALGLILIGFGSLILIGGSAGSDNPLIPLAVFTVKNSASGISTGKVKTLKDIQTALATSDKPVILDFYADWCHSCKVMEKTTLQDLRVRNLLKNYRLLKVDITDNNREDKEIMKKYQVIAPPTFLFFNAKGEWLSQKTFTGEISAEDFIKQLKTD